MKRKFFVLSVTILILLSNLILTSASNDELKALSSDITAWINLQSIRSYTIDNATYIIAEDLPDYGFTVIWNNYERALKITCNYEPAKMSDIRPNEIHIAGKNLDEFDTFVIGHPIYDVFTTNIKVYLDANIVDSYNIDGRTLIKMDDLGRYGYLYWIPFERRISLDIMDKKLYNDLENANDKQELVIAENTTYIGQISNGKPNGIGKMTKSEYLFDKYYTYTETYTGYFKDGKKYGFFIYDYHYSQIRTSDIGTKTVYGHYNYENDMKSGYCISYKSELYQSSSRQESLRYVCDGFYKNDMLNGYGRTLKSRHSPSEEYRYMLVEHGEYIDDLLQE